MLRFLLGRKLARLRSVRRLAFVASLFLVAATLPFVTRGARHTDEPVPGILNRDAVAGKASRAPEFVPGQVLVRYRSEAAAKGAEAAPLALQSRADGDDISVRVERFEGSNLVGGLRLAHVAPEETLQAVESLRAQPDVLYAEPDYLRYKQGVPNDTEFSNMWGLRNTGQSITVNSRSSNPNLCPTLPCTFAGGTLGADIKAEQAWNLTTGDPNVVVGVIDEGIDISHPDLAANIFTNPGEVPDNGVDDDQNGKVDDVHGWDFTSCTSTSDEKCGDNKVFDGDANPANYPDDQTDAHGTHVAGTIGAVGNNGLGVTGVNWNVRILPLKFLGNGGGSASNAIRAAAYAKALRDKWVATNGAQGANVRVLNNSYGGGAFTVAERDGIAALGTSGILFVAAAGNDGENNDVVQNYPANYEVPNLLSVAAVDRRDLLPSFSNFGARKVHLAAPGSLILSTTPNGTYDFFFGTSMATPHVAGAAALVLARNPNISLQNLRGSLLYSGDLIFSTASNTYSRRRLNAVAAVQAATDTTPPAQLGNLRVQSQGGRLIALAWTAPGGDANTERASLYEVTFTDNTVFPAKTYSLGTSLPNVAGSSEFLSVNVPYRHPTGTINVKTIDRAGNESNTSLPVSVNPASVDPYTVAVSGAQPLSTGTETNLQLNGDDMYRADYPLPFAFPFYGRLRSSLTISTNGALYFSTPPRRGNGDADDAGSSIAALQNQSMIAGLWDDIDINTSVRPDSGVYVVRPDANRIIFRWQGVTFVSPRVPVNFEIELRSDGTIQMRYGDNSRIFPVVGISGGEPEAYLVNSHTREFIPNNSQPINLTNAQTVTFSVRPQVDAGSQSFQFSAANYSENENSPVGSSLSHGALLRVTRVGNMNAPATIDVNTVDNTADVPCDPTARDANGNLFPQGTAYARCDYATTLETLQFAAGEASKDVRIPLINDAHVEGPETVQVVLSNPTGGATLGTQRTATLTIIDDDVAGQSNPILGNSFFVRQQYLDFLSREPEAGEPWTNVLNRCSDVNNDPACDRLTVTSSFFRSPEFQLKGFFVYRFYSLSFGRLPLYSEIIPDMRSVTGATGPEVFQKRALFANNWIERPAFKSLYGGATAADFVNALMDRYGLQTITTPDPANPDGEARIALTRGQLVTGLNTATLTRAQVMRAIVESDQVFAAEFNRAFVAMQYFGYLRRDPDTSGFNGWNTYLRDNPTDFRTMVRGFANSREYTGRFGTAL